MNEKIEKVENILKEHDHVSFVKQCKEEYITYSYFINFDRDKIIMELKVHFKNKELEKSRNVKNRKMNMSIDWFLNDKVYDLINRGYDIEDIQALW